MVTLTGASPIMIRLVGYPDRLRRTDTGGARRWLMPAAAPAEVVEADVETTTKNDRPWIVLVWNDPINLMSYVTLVLKKLFNFSTAKAEKLMLDVHHKGRAVVSSGPREQAEFDVFRLHEHGLWATMEQPESNT